MSMHRWVCCGLLAVFWAASPAAADTIILHSGERIRTESYRESGGFVRFKLHGLDARVPSTSVRRIVPDDSRPEKEPPRPLPARPVTVPMPPAPKAAPVKKSPPPKPETASKPVPSRPAPPRLTIGQIMDKIPRIKTRIGFRGLFWESTPQQIIGLKRIGTDRVFGGIDQYVSMIETLRFEGAVLEKVVYGFIGVRFITVTVTIPDRENYEIIRRWAVEKFGEGIVSKELPGRQIWKGGPTERLLEFDEKSGKGLLWLRNEGLWRQLEAGKKKESR